MTARALRDDGNDDERTSAQTSAHGPASPACAEGAEELAQVHYLSPTNPTTSTSSGSTRGRQSVSPGSPVSLAGEVLEGRVVTAEEYQRLTARGAVVKLRTGSVVTGRVVATVATHERTKTVAKATVRNVLYVPGGAMVCARRGWESRSTARYQRMMRQAEAAGNADLLADWESRAEAFEGNRHKRAKDWLQAPVLLAKALAMAALSTGVTLLALGALLASARGDAG